MAWIGRELGRSHRGQDRVEARSRLRWRSPTTHDRAGRFRGVDESPRATSWVMYGNGPVPATSGSTEVRKGLRCTGPKGAQGISRWVLERWAQERALGGSAQSAARRPLQLRRLSFGSGAVTAARLQFGRLQVLDGRHNRRSAGLSLRVGGLLRGNVLDDEGLPVGVLRLRALEGLADGVGIGPRLCTVFRPVGVD
jgi:hypothetical protein